MTAANVKRSSVWCRGLYPNLDRQLDLIQMYAILKKNMPEAKMRKLKQLTKDLREGNVPFAARYPAEGVSEPHLNTEPTPAALAGRGGPLKGRASTAPRRRG
jgi:hypothetical protein